jgi:hypothetical protein
MEILKSWHISWFFNLFLDDTGMLTSEMASLMSDIIFLQKFQGGHAHADQEGRQLQGVPAE